MPCPPPKMLKDGFYVGGQVGYDSYRVREGITLASPGTLTGNPVINATGWVGGLFVGYGQYFNDIYYLGGEVFGNYSGADQSYSLTDTGTYNSKVEARGGYGISVLPGVKLNDASFGYVRLCYNWSNLKTTESTDIPTSGNKSNTSGGFNYGVGIETLVYENWSVRGEYTHTGYNSFTSALNTSINPSDNQFMLGVLYHFA